MSRGEGRAGEKVIVVTAGDANYDDLVEDLIDSLPGRAERTFDLAYVRLGGDHAPAAIAARVDRLAMPPRDDGWIPGAKGFELAFRGLKARLPELFPGYDIYVWLDGDTWVQNAAGIPELAEASAHADIAIHPELDVHYLSQPVPNDYTLMVYDRIYGPEEARLYTRRPMVNSGVFAARAGSPLWARWREALMDSRERQTGRTETFYSDQIPLHRLIHSGALTVRPLRAVNNWMVLMAMPVLNFQRRRLLVPTPPHEEIHILHLVGAAKDSIYQVGDTGRTMSFRYRDVRALFDAAAAQSGEGRPGGALA